MEGRLLIVSGLLIAVIVVFALLGERTLSWFDGDRAQAARAYKVGAMLLAGSAFALAMPKICSFAADKLQAVFTKAGQSGGIASAVLSKSFPGTMTTAGYVLCCVFLIATCLGAWSVWSNHE